MIKKGYKHSEKTKKKMSISHKKRFADNPELNKLRCIQTKRLMREGKIKGFQKGEMNIARRPEIRKILSKKTKEQMRLHPTKGMLGKHHSEETKQKLRNISKEQFKNGMPQETKDKISNKLKGRKISEETRLKMKNKIFSEEHRKNLSIANKGKKFPIEKYPNYGIRGFRKNLIIPVKDTSIEIKIQNFLKKLKLDFFTHQYIKEIKHGYQCDIFIPFMNLVIECDGDYWHKYPVGNEIDTIRTKELLEKGFKVLRLWERDIRVMDLNNFKERLLKI